MSKKILVTGANGQLGREISRLYSGREDIEIIGTDVAGDNITKLDITNVDEVVNLAKQVKPYAIINCAAHTGVDACETDIDNAYKINAIGPRNLSIAANETSSKIIQVSTDYVFEGNGTKPYIEFDAPNPQGIYGKSKLQGEEFVKQIAQRGFTIRTAWLYGDGNNFVKTMLRLAETRDTLGVVSDQIGSPTSTRTLGGIIDNLLFTDNYGLFHGTCEGVCSWADFAEEIFRLAGKNITVNKLTTDQYPTPAKRPAYSVLENYMLKITSGYMAEDWKDALKIYMSEM